MNMISEIIGQQAKRLSLLALGFVALTPAWALSPVLAQEASTYSTTSDSTSYILVGTAVFQMIFIIVIASIMKNLGKSTDVWTKAKKNGGAALLLALLAVPMMGFTTAETPFLLMKINDLFWLLVSVNIILFLIVVVMLGILRGMIRNLREDKVQEEVVEEEQDILASVAQSLTKAVDIEHEDEILMDHEYDGIRELDNVLPPWWLWLFYGSCIFAVVYLLMYHVFAIWPLSDEEYRIAMQEGEEEVAAWLAAQKDRVDENTVVLLTDEQALGNGEKVYNEKCVACHAPNGGGGIGPNFTDNYWLHGCDIKDVFKTVKYGVVQNGMQSWKAELSPVEIANVSSFILTKFQTGTPVEGGKEAQGEECTTSAGGDADDNTEMPADSVTTDTLVTAMLR